MLLLVFVYGDRQAFPFVGLQKSKSKTEEAIPGSEESTSLRLQTSFGPAADLTAISSRCSSSTVGRRLLIPRMN
jgi:hypothetical protein